MVWEDADFIIMVVGSNTRKDFHVNEGEEFFYQLEGDIVLKVQDDGTIVDIPIRAGEIFLLPPGVPHSPRRPENTVGLVIEKKREAGQMDGFQWYCEACGHKLHEEFAHITNIVTQLPPLLARFYNDESKRVCKKCGARFSDPAKPK
jgi:3-hydroxyanthranilate 3,4-dioxygenase